MRLLEHGEPIEARESAIINEYNAFMRAKHIGVTFGTDDLTVEQVNMFYEIQRHQESKDGK